jgi:hypothetical protein
VAPTSSRGARAARPDEATAGARLAFHVTRGACVFVTLLHNQLATTMLYFMFVCGVWAVIGSFRGGISGSLAGALVLGEGLILLQGVLGIILYLTGHRPAQGLHFLYGVAAAVTLPGIYSYVKGRSSRAQALSLGLGALFIVGLAIRGIVTATTR